MQVLNPIIQNIYSCMFCSQEFESQVELKIWWFCSNSCRFKFAFGLVQLNFPDFEKEQKLTKTKEVAGWLK